MEEFEFKGKKTKVIVLTVCIVLALIALVVIITSGENSNEQNNIGNNGNGQQGSISGDNQPVGENETELSSSEASNFFDNIPLMYTEEFAPFSDYFILTAAMDIVSREETPNYTANHVDNIVKDIFGKDVSINKDNVTTVDVTKSLYYYYPQTGTYAIIPVGMESIYKTQLLKKATKKGEFVYVYAYELNGTWHMEEDKAVVVIGDKNGNDLVKSFDNYENTQDFSIWQKEHKDMLPVIRYTLKKVNDAYILVGVEKINY